MGIVNKSDIIVRMVIRDKSLVSNEYYHLYNRGNGKHEIFLDEYDYNHFIKLLFICNSENKFVFRESIVESKIDAFDFEIGKPLVSILSWVLMPNHFHIVLISHRLDLWEKGVNPITEFMRKISTAYAMYFNKKYKRTGSLFEGNFKSRHIGEENYFNYIFSYVHLNPIKLIQSDWKENGIIDKNKAKDFLKGYEYSSFQDYFGKNRKQGCVIDINSIPEYCPHNYMKDLFEWIKIEI